MSSEMPRASFSALVQVVAEQALVAMGGPHPLIPADQLPSANPQVARFFVDLLDVVKERTRGNLGPGEVRELDDVLCALRMRIVGGPPAMAVGAPQGDGHA